MNEPGIFGDALRRLRTERGLSVRALAKLTHHSKTVISEWENGRKVPDEATAAQLDHMLGAGGTLAAAARLPGLNGNAGRLAHVAAAPRTVDGASVDALAGVLSNMRRLEDGLGAERLIVLTAEPLRLVQDLADEARGKIRPDVVDLAGQWAQFAGWLRAATGRAVAARDWYARSLEHAAETGNADLTATSMSMRGNLAWMARQPGAVIGLSSAAADRAASPGIRAMAAQQEARGHALLGEADEARELLDEAEAEMAVAAEHPEDEPPWIYFYSPSYLRMQRGLAARLLGRPAEAIDQLRSGLDLVGVDVSGSEFGAQYKLYLAEAHLDVGEADVAGQLVGEVRQLAEATGSERLAAEVARLEGRLLE